jgi:hypothetical protein
MVIVYCCFLFWKPTFPIVDLDTCVASASELAHLHANCLSCAVSWDLTDSDRMTLIVRFRERMLEGWMHQLLWLNLTILNEWIDGWMVELICPSQWLTEWFWLFAWRAVRQISFIYPSIHQFIHSEWPYSVTIIRASSLSSIHPFDIHTLKWTIRVIRPVSVRVQDIAQDQQFAWRCAHSVAFAAHVSRFTIAKI